MGFNVFDISASGMYAQRMKLDVVASNIANMNTTRRPDGTKGVYAKKDVTFRAVYDDKISDTPAFPNGQFEPFFSKNKNDVVLSGGIFYDENKITSGVEVARISDSKNPYKFVYDPSHPDSDADGYVKLPNVNVVEEMVQMISASKAYEANVAAVDSAKSMISAALKI